LDDRFKLGGNFALYARGEWSLDPFFVDARSDARTIGVEERRLRLELERDRKSWSWAAGSESARSLTRPSQDAAWGWALYGRMDGRFRNGFGVYARAAYFDFGSRLLGRRDLYIALAEPYWKGIHLASVAYESLFATYAGQGLRQATAAQRSIGAGLELWLKWGGTFLDKPAAAGPRWDFKTEIAWKW